MENKLNHEPVQPRDKMDINHVALLLDGHRRWAKLNNVSIEEGYQRAIEILPSLIEYCWKSGIHTVTVWLLTTDNVVKRPKDQLDIVYEVIWKILDSIEKIAERNQSKIVHLGRKDRISVALQNKLVEAETITSKYDKHIFNAAIDYSAKGEMLHIAQKILESGLTKEQLTDEFFKNQMYSVGQPYPQPDLIIRPGNVMRLSGFMSWDSAFSELVFSHKFFPDFTIEDLEESFREFHQRQRRLGA